MIAAAHGSVCIASAVDKAFIAQGKDMREYNSCLSIYDIYPSLLLAPSKSWQEVISELVLKVKKGLTSKPRRLDVTLWS